VTVSASALHARVAAAHGQPPAAPALPARPLGLRVHLWMTGARRGRRASSCCIEGRRACGRPERRRAP
jgi:hypothetical protein